MSVTRHNFLSLLHSTLQPRGYLEVGVHQGDSLVLAACPALGIDPAPILNRNLRHNETIIVASSDQFFESAANEAIPIVDLAFIDGMHLFEFALRDFMNVEQHSNLQTVVVFDDMLPRNQEEAARDQCLGDWTGDVWKVTNLLSTYRPDLELRLVDTFPTGTLVVWNLDPGNQKLSDLYETIRGMKLDQFNEVPPDVINRTEVYSPYDVLQELMSWLRTFDAPELRPT